MAEFQYIEIPLGALDTSSDPTTLPPGSLTIADNLSADTPGRYDKRKGYTALQNLVNRGVAPVGRLAALGEELLAIGGPASATYLASHVTAYGAFALPDDWLTVGRIHEAATEQQSVHADQDVDITKATRVTCNGFAVHAWINSNGWVFAKVIDASGAGGVIAHTLLDGIGPWDIVHVVAAGTRVLVFYSSATAQQIKYTAIDCLTTGLSFGGSTLLFSGANVYAAGAPFDACPLSSTEVVIAYATNAPVIVAAKFNAGTLAVTASATVSAEVPAAGIAVLATAGEFGTALYYSSGAGGMRACHFNASTMVVTVAAYAVEAGVSAVGRCGLVRADATHVYAVWERAAVGIVKPYVQWRRLSSAGALDPIRGPLRNVALYAKPWTYDGGFFAVLYSPHSLQNTYFTVRLNEANGNTPFATVTAVHAPRGAYTSVGSNRSVPEVDVLATGVYAFDGIVGIKFLSTAAPRGGAASFVVNFVSPRRYLTCQLGGEALFGGGVVARYDGNAVAEANFLLYPEITQATPGAVGAAGMDNGTYSYIAIYESAQMTTNVDRSTTSLPVSATTAAGAGLGKVTLTVDHLSMTKIGNGNTAPQRPATGVISIFRTKAAGTTYFFVGSVAMDLTLASSTYVDQAHDNTIGSNRVLYTAGGVLDREPPPPCTHIVTHRNRAWGISAADPKVVFYSGEYVQGEGVWFSTLQQFRVDAGGDCVGLASLDDKLVVFKADRIFKVYGSGLNPLGQNSDLSPPLLVTTDCGCADPRSIVETGDGVMFMSDRGIHLLSRSEEVTYIGSPVELYTGFGIAAGGSAANAITAARLLVPANEVRFERTGGQKIVYNYRTGRWTTHGNYQGATAVDAIVVGGVYHWATAAGAVYRESATSFLDPGSTHVTSTLELAWIAPAGRQGLARVRNVTVLDEYVESHGLFVSVGYDYEASYSMNLTWTPAQVGPLPRDQFSARLTKQKICALRVLIADAPSVSPATGESCRFRGFAMMASAKRGGIDKALVAGAKG